MEIAVMPMAVHTGNLINGNTSMSNALFMMYIKDR